MVFPESLWTYGQIYKCPGNTQRNECERARNDVVKQLRGRAFWDVLHNGIQERFVAFGLAQTLGIAVDGKGVGIETDQVQRVGHIPNSSRFTFSFIGLVVVGVLMLVNFNVRRPYNRYQVPVLAHADLGKHARLCSLSAFA